MNIENIHDSDLEHHILMYIDVPFFRNNPSYIKLWQRYYYIYRSPSILQLMMHKKISLLYHWIYVEFAKLFCKKKRFGMAKYVLELGMKSNAWDLKILENEFEKLPKCSEHGSSEMMIYLCPKNIMAFGRTWNVRKMHLFYQQDLFMTSDGEISIEEYRHSLEISKKDNKLKVELKAKDSTDNYLNLNCKLEKSQVIMDENATNTSTAPCVVGNEATIEDLTCVENNENKIIEQNIYSFHLEDQDIAKTSSLVLTHQLSNNGRENPITRSSLGSLIKLNKGYFYVERELRHGKFLLVGFDVSKDYLDARKYVAGSYTHKSALFKYLPGHIVVEENKVILYKNEILAILSDIICDLKNVKHSGEKLKADKHANDNLGEINSCAEKSSFDSSVDSTKKMQIGQKIRTYYALQLYEILKILSRESYTVPNLGLSDICIKTDGYVCITNFHFVEGNFSWLDYLTLFSQILNREIKTSSELNNIIYCFKMNNDNLKERRMIVKQCIYLLESKVGIY